MKQKKIGDILYVFDVTPYEITEDTDAEIIKVQQECYEGFVYLNESLADKIVKYNYHMFTVTQQEWAPYVDEPDPEPEPVEKIDPELSWGDSVCTVGIDDVDPQFLTLTNEYNVSPIVYSSSDSEVATIDAETGAITLVAEGTTDITAEFAGDDEYEADSVTYELTVEAAQPEPEPVPTRSVSYVQWEPAYDGTEPQGYTRYLNEGGIGQTPIDDVDPDYYSTFTVTIESTDYTFDPVNEDQDGYVWDDPVTKSVALRNNGGVEFPDVYVAPAITGEDPATLDIEGTYEPKPAPTNYMQIHNTTDPESGDEVFDFMDVELANTDTFYGNEDDPDTYDACSMLISDDHGSDGSGEGWVWTKDNDPTALNIAYTPIYPIDPNTGEEDNSLDPISYDYVLIDDTDDSGNSNVTLFSIVPTYDDDPNDPTVTEYEITPASDDSLLGTYELRYVEPNNL